jgi:hypothetical protein
MRLIPKRLVLLEKVKRSETKNRLLEVFATMGTLANDKIPEGACCPSG